MDENITIIEGPPPTFEAVNEGWVMGLNEGPTLGNLAITRLRTYNGPALVERCHRAWRQDHPIYLEFRDPDGLERAAPIVAVRNTEVEEGHLLLLWVRLDDEEVEVELGYDDDIDFDDDLDDDFNLSDL